jgi:RND family efflux transporter MFP subunit
MKTRHILSFAALIISAGLFQACTDSKGHENKIPKASEPIPVKILELKKSSSTHTITASGRITTDDETVLGFKIGGVVNSVLVKEGDQIRKGQLLATLDLTEIQAQVSQARHQYEKAQRDFKRTTNLYKDSVATLEQLQNTETALAVAKEQLQAATFNQSHAEIHAPAAGFVLRKFVNAGQVVGIGDAILQTNGAVSNRWVVKIGVSDKQWSRIRVRDQATIRMDAFADRTFQGIVTRKAETSDPQTGTFTIEIDVKHDGAKLASGMFASVEIHSGDAVSSWTVPYEAVLDANDDQGFVFVTNDQKTAVRQPVKIESFDGKSIHINEGLENAGALIVSGSAYLTDHSPITIIR